MVTVKKFLERGLTVKIVKKGFKSGYFDFVTLLDKSRSRWCIGFILEKTQEFFV